ncbi:MAG: FtsW/RodA/SpoVE family cell cycle protein [candidate division WOR-3 bacterium]
MLAVSSHNLDLNRRSQYPDLVIVAVVIGLLMTGLIMVYSAKLYVDQRYLGHQAVRIGVGLLMLALGMILPLEGLQRKLWLVSLVLILMIGVLVGVRLFGTSSGGAARSWHGIQPSEFAKLMLVLFLSVYYQRLEPLGESERRFGTFVLLPFLLCLPVVVLIAAQPAVSMALVCLALVLSLMYLAEVRVRDLLKLGLAIIVLGAIGLTTVQIATHKIEFEERFRHVGSRISSYRGRVTRLFDIPAQLELTPVAVEPIDWQQWQSWIAIGSGGATGKGTGNGMQKLHFLPMVHTDFIYGLIGEEWGFLGSLAVFGAFLVFAWRGLSLALRGKDTFSRLVTTGVTMMICYTALVHLGVNLWLLPPTGQTLPLVSFGGSAMAANLLGVGMLLRLSRQISRRPIEVDLASRFRNWWSTGRGASCARWTTWGRWPRR